MTILDSLHHKMKILPVDTYDPSATMQPPAKPEQIEKPLEHFPNVPRDYLELIRLHNGMTFMYNIPGSILFIMRILSVEDAIDMMLDWHPYLIENMPNTFFFGQDGDEVYLYGTNNGKYGVYRVGIADGEWDGAEYIGKSLASILVEGEGWASY
ncbi:SMI1/KNR4 family protein [Deinococcus ruber]|nr:SMI1/KNR4 family protein [Deinococcus ruber]